MKKTLLLAFLFSAIYSCKTSTAPKEVATQFIQAVYSGDAATASSLATEKTKTNIGLAKHEAPGGTAEETFSFATLTESVNGNTAEVKNELVKISLLKEDAGWLVDATPYVVASISNRQMDLAALKTKWETLLKEYEARLKIANEYVQYKKGQGTLSPQLQSLNEMINTLSAKTTWDKEKILQYTQRQKQLAAMIDKSIEPSYTAGSDMGMNYILQLSNANDRIKTAQAEYNSLAQTTPSATYPALP
jgi:chromosome segregation ATPase